MKQLLITFLSRYSYPQKDFAASIINHINQPISLLVDAPCGNGETTQLFFKKINCKIIGADSSQKSIQYAKNNYSKKIFFFQKDIATLTSEISNVDAFCLINSIFLLPQPQTILKDIKTTLSQNGKLYVIIPNINSINYLNFNSKNPTVNNLQLNHDDFIKYTEDIGYKFLISKKLCFANVYGRPELKYFSIFSMFYLHFLNFLFKKFSNKEPSYFLFIFSKN